MGTFCDYNYAPPIPRGGKGIFMLISTFYMTKSFIYGKKLFSSQLGGGEPSGHALMHFYKSII